MRLPPLGDLAGWLAAREALVPRLRPGCAKRIDWAGRAGVRTPLAVVYVHGYTASPRELEPLPELVAQGLGANLYLARLAGHGQDGAAMGEATFAQWRADVAEAFAIGRSLGERVLVMGCSTGCTLMALALAEGEPAFGAVMISPNFGVRSRRMQLLLDLPVVRTWLPRLLPDLRGEPGTGAAEGVWTHAWPTRALIPMAQAVRAVRGAHLDAIAAPALFAYAEADQVVDPARSASVMARWGGPVTHLALDMVPGGDAMGHVLAGPISPAGTGPMVAAILDWARAL